ncbi:MAG: ATPase [Clostridia bacterium]|nr:ATPase [Clostridia bacterium]
MQENGKTSHFFLSANTPQGFISRPEQLYNARDGWRAYILKGGPGTGKSHFIEKVGKAMQGLDMNVEYIHCTSDSSAYDGLAVPALKVCVLDGTPPHEGVRKHKKSCSPAPCAGVRSAS